MRASTADLDLTHPAIADLRRTARRRIPHFAFEYLDSATGTEAAARRNRAALDNVLFQPAILAGDLSYATATTFMGRDYPLPFGIAPIGMAGMIWPDAERLLARAAATHQIPYCQSTVAAAAPEDTGPIAKEMGWFQHYPVHDLGIMRDMLERIKAAGFSNLVITVDVPGESRRERQRRAHVAMPPRLTPSMIVSMMTHPRWALAMARSGPPRMPFPESYVDASAHDAFVHAGRVIRGWPDWDYFAALRAAWAGPLIIKGVSDPAMVPRLLEAGADALWVSNHTGRQFDGGPAAITQLPLIRATAGPDTPIIFDSGIDGGLDILRALSLGADFTFLGRAFMYAVAAFAARGIDHLIHILRADLEANMAQLGAATLSDVKERLLP
ncbi:alpha-hydroxy acid oxidase [Shimia ponticola]|uniref:alpha-hydroxy acid oxidase n=1 Tax=Shimia ponticola TaxID=2582893 RepID=UPI00210534C0|nr:alpha-hydroxy acid oxidase [Shimia ponticola]